MRFIYRILTVVCVLSFAFCATAQNISNRGKDFWVAYGFHEGMFTGNDQEMVIYLSVEDLPPGKNVATVVVEADSSGANSSLWWRRVYKIPANTVISTEDDNAASFSPACTKVKGTVPKGPTPNGDCFDLRLYSPGGCADVEKPYGHGIFRGGKGIHITSDVDIVAFAHIYTTANSGATMLLPTTSWGYSYTTLNSNQINVANAPNFFYVIAQEDSTVIRVTPSQAPWSAPCITDVPLQSKTIILNKGWIYQYLGFVSNNGNNLGSDLTGSKIESIPNDAGKCKKIAVFAGSARTGGEAMTGSSQGSRDNDMQQCFPEHTWGNIYLTAPFASGSGSSLSPCDQRNCVYKIVAKDTGTILTINGTVKKPIPLYSFVKFESNVPCKFEGNKPVAVAQYMGSSNSGSGDGDPEMIFLSPIDQAINKVGFYRNTSTQINSNFVAIILPDSGMSSLKILKTGADPSLPTSWDSLGNNFGGNACVRAHPQNPVVRVNGLPVTIPYKIVIKAWTSAKKQVFVKCDSSRFNCITYGLGGVESYGYSGGTYLNNLAGKPKYFNTTDTFVNPPKPSNFEHPYLFDSSATDLRVAMEYPPKRIDWLFNIMQFNKQLIDTDKIILKRTCDNVQWESKVDTQRGYFYTPPFDFNGNDTFYTKGCSSTGTCVYNMHVVTVGCEFHAQKPATKFITLASGAAPYSGNAAIDISPVCGNTSTSYQYCAYNMKTGTCAISSVSNRGGKVNINATSSAFTYIAPSPAAQFVGTDTFYIQVCDNKGSCVIKEYIITVGTQFATDGLIAIRNATPNTATPLSGNATIEFNPTGGKTPLSYSITDASGNSSLTSANGSSVSVSGSNYNYSPLAAGLDSFYVKVCDNNNPNSCAIQKHIVTVGNSYSANSNYIQNYTTLNTAIKGSASDNMNVKGGIGGYTYTIVNGSGATVTTSNKGGTVIIKPGNGIYSYTPITGLTGKDTFYTKVCDASATPNCTTQMVIVDINPTFTATTATFNETVNNQSQINDQAGTQMNPVGGTPPYSYYLADIFQKKLGFNAFSRRGGTVMMNPSGNGNYQYVPPVDYVGQDTFWVVVSDSSTTPNVLIQMHLVSVYPAIIGNTTPIYHSIPSDQTLSGNLQAEMPTIPRVSLSVFTPVDSKGDYSTWSTRVKWSKRYGEISMVPLPIDTLIDALKGDKFYYKALPTLDPECDYIFIKKYPNIDRIDTVYIPLVVYSKPKNGLPAGCYGAGGLIGDTLKLPYYIYPKPRINKKLIFPSSCPTDNSITFADVDSSVAVSLRNQRHILPVIKALWQISGKYNGKDTFYTDSTKIVTHIFDTGTQVCFKLTNTFKYGGINVFDSCFTFRTSKVKMDIKPVRICINSSITVIDKTFSSTGTDSSFWDFGNGITKYGDSIVYIYPNAGNYTIKHTIKIKNCNAKIDTIFQNVVVDASLHPSIVAPLNCIDTSGKASFYYDSTLGGAPANLYNWTFYDKGNSVIGTSNINPASYTFSREDSFKVKLYIEDTNHCKGDTTITTLIHIMPHLQFSLFSGKGGICVNNSDTAINIKDSAKCLNYQKVKGYGKFKGRGITDSIGVFNPAMAGAGMVTVWYIYYDSTGLCVDSVSSTFEVFKKPAVNWDYSPKGCLPKDGLVHFKNSSSDGFDFWWTFDDAANTYYTNNENIVNSIDTSHSFFNTGLHNVKLYSETDKGCADSLIKPIIFTVTPNIVYKALSPVCESAGIIKVDSADFNNGVNKTDVKGWYYGNGVDTLGNLSPAVAGYGNDSITYIADLAGCRDTAYQYKLIKARPRLGFTYPVGCLPPNGAVQFIDTSKMPDGQTIQSCAWTFGDPGSGANTANTCNASHTYSYGTYTIYHVVNSSLGCTTDTTFQATFSISPSLYYNAIPQVCESDTTHSIKYAGSNNLSQAPGTGIYKGPGVIDSINGIINPRLVGAGTYTMYYVFTATSGCVRMDSQTVVIKGGPRGTFTFAPNSGCLNTNGFVQFDASNIKVQGSTISGYAWDFGNGTGSGVNPGNTYNNDGTYTIRLTVTASNACVFDTSMTQTFNKTPQLGLLQQGDTCENLGNITLRPATVLNGASGSGVFRSYKNAVIDSVSGTYDPAISKCGVDTIYYIYTTPGGCSASRQISFNVLCRPTGTFVYNPNVGCLDTTGLVSFDASATTVPNSGVSSYNWDFGNGTGTGQTTTNHYNDGTYTIKLNTKGVNGCSFDTSVTATFSKTPHVEPLTQSAICTNGGTVPLKVPNILNNVAGTGTFWSSKNAVTGTTYDPAKAGSGFDTLYYKYVNNNNPACFSIDSIQVTVKSQAVGTAVVTNDAACLDITGLASFDATGYATPNSTIVDYRWEFGDGDTLHGVTVTHNYKANGNYTIKLSIKSANGCDYDTIINRNYSITPSFGSFTYNAVCENGGNVTITPAPITNGAVAASSSFHSSRGAFVDSVSGLYNPAVAGYGSDTITYTVKSNGGCTASATMVLTIKARPYGTFDFTPANGCLDANGRVVFTSNINVPNSSVQIYTWDFGDSKSGTGQSVTHNYTNDNAYTIKLSVLANNNCSSDTSLTATFNRTPRLGPFTYSKPICENGDTFSFTAPNVLNSVVGMGIYTSAKGGIVNNITGTYDPKLVGYGTDTITYTYTSLSGNCPDSKTMVIKILGAPTGSFSFVPASGCLDITGKVKFNTSAITVPGSSAKTYAWQFEAPGAVINGNNPTHNYSDGTYDIKLTVTGNNTCSNDFWIKNQKFSRMPDVDPITLDSRVCANSSPFLLAAPTVSNNVLGPTGVFTSYKNNVSGDGVVGYTYTPVISNSIIDTIYYTFTSFNQCSTMVKKVIYINPVPTPKLIHPVNICVNNSTTLVDNSIVFNGNVDSTFWVFKDTTIKNPKDRSVIDTFKQVGVNGIRLIVKSDSGCIGTDTFNTNVRPKPVAAFSFNNTVCMPNGLVIFANNSVIDAFGGTLKYMWNYGDVASNISSQNPNTGNSNDGKHIYAAIGNYTVKLVAASKEYGCTDSILHTLTNKGPFYQKPVADFYVSKDTVCEDEFIVFNDSASFAPGSSIYRWNWNYDDGSSSATSVPSSVYAYHRTNTSYIYHPKLTVRSKELCESDPVSKTVWVYPRPRIDSMQPLYAMDGIKVDFKPKVNDSVNFNFTWMGNAPYYNTGITSTNTLNTALIPNLQAILGTNAPGVNNPAAVYQLVAVGQNNCSDTAYQVVRILAKINIPNTFSPNGDGINDTWDITSLGDYPNAKLDIYDRYGNRIISLAGANMRWDGKINGSPAPVATYYYIISLGNNSAPITGWVALLR